MMKFCRDTFLWHLDLSTCEITPKYCEWKRDLGWKYWSKEFFHHISSKTILDNLQHYSPKAASKEAKIIIKIKLYRYGNFLTFNIICKFFLLKIEVSEIKVNILFDVTGHCNALIWTMECLCFVFSWENCHIHLFISRHGLWPILSVYAITDI